MRYPVTASGQQLCIKECLVEGLSLVITSENMLSIGWPLIPFGVAFDRCRLYCVVFA